MTSERLEILRRARLAQAKAELKAREQEAARQAYAPIPGIGTPPLTSAGPGLAGRTLPQALGRRADDVVRSLASGMTAEFADELAAAGQAATTGQPYSEALAAERARDVQIPPAIRTVGNIGGALTTGTGLGRAIR